ncbi:Multidrug resistance protein NorM [Blautia producta]|uniref:Probable multidrug resistance protein NorM n=1 Tax=Blautia producta TaxID=33035 RepID=A0A4P6M2L6_9FIRM|nr:MATE family efflux transporter [Blautia producta]QBE98662.1 Multidrug resistance protein NorM [Blautia producta]
MQKDMTAGSPAKAIVGFTIPVLIGNIFQQFYSMVDTIIVGKFVGTKALAAVGSVGTINFLIIGFMLGLTAGFTVLTAQRYGAGDMKNMRRTVGSAAVLSLMVTVVMTLVSMLGMHGLLEFMHTPEDIFADAYQYIMIICGGIFATVLYNLLASVLRALGNSQVPLYFLILSALLNVLLDLLFIIVFQWGAAGAAYATVISQGVSGVLCLVYIAKKMPELRLQKDDFRLSAHIVKMQVGIGIPMALQYSITAIGTMMVQSALNMLGSMAVAAFTAASKVEQIATQAYVALGTTMATYCAQNIGAGKIDRIRKGFRATTWIGVIYSLVFGLLTAFFGKYLTYLFVSSDVQTLMGQVDIYLKCASLFFIALNIVNVYRNGIQGMGYGVLPMMAGVAELLGRGIVALAAGMNKSYLLACLASPVAWVFAGVLLLFMYRIVMKQQEKIFVNSNV